MDSHVIDLWGAADLRDFAKPTDESGQGFLFAVAWAISMVCPHGLKRLKEKESK
jgi:hypothetical protein